MKFRVYLEALLVAGNAYTWYQHKSPAVGLAIGLFWAVVFLHPKNGNAND